MKKKIHVHVADDHKILIEGLVAVINTDEDIKLVGSSLDGKEVLKNLKTRKADVLILDINMPKLDGIGVLEYFKNKSDSPKIIILSSYDDLKMVSEVVEMGAKGFLHKKYAGEHILKAIKTVFEDKQYFTEDIREELLNLYTGKANAKRESVDSISGVKTQSLTDREIEVLKLIAKELSTSEIADILRLSSNTVDTYRKSLLKKLNVKNSVGIAKYAIKNEFI